MKSIGRLSFILAAAILMAVAGCSTVSTSHVQDVGGAKFPPSNPAQVQILRVAPTRTHVRLGEVRAQPSSDRVEVLKIEEALRKEAAKLGADAAVVVYDKTQVTGSVVMGPWWGPSVQPIESRIVIAVAIKYK